METLRSCSNNARLMAVVKADAYGQGMGKVAKALEPYVDYYAVSYASEGVSLRRYIRLTPILVFIYSSSDIHLAIKYHLCLSISSIRELIELSQAIGDSDAVCDVNLAVNTGMNRYGFSTKPEYISAINYINMSRGIRLRGVYSHLYDSDPIHNAKQMAIFDEYVDIAKHISRDEFVTHICASHGTLAGINKYDMARLGIAMYVGEDERLVDAVTLKSKIQSIKTVKWGEFIGYSCHYKAKCDIILGVVYGGYADGLDMRLSGMDVIVGGHHVPIIGDICMDVFFVDLSHVDAKVGDEVTIIGGSNTITAVADYVGTTSYEILSSLYGRVMRSYI